MRLPNRKPGQYANQELDTHITPSKYKELKANLEKLKKNIRPHLIKEVQRLALFGDFSENAEYQLAKGKLRGINKRILEIEKLLNHAKIIDSSKHTDTVQIGHSVTIETAGKTKTFKILGSAETNPSAGVISKNSPIGSALLNQRVGNIVEIERDNKIFKYKILKIE